MSDKNEQARQRANERIKVLALRLNGQEQRTAQERASSWLSSIRPQ